MTTKDFICGSILTISGLLLLTGIGMVIIAVVQTSSLKVNSDKWFEGYDMIMNGLLLAVVAKVILGITGIVLSFMENENNSVN